MGAGSGMLLASCKPAELVRLISALKFKTRKMEIQSDNQTWPSWRKSRHISIACEPVGKRHRARTRA